MTELQARGPHRVRYWIVGLLGWGAFVIGWWRVFARTTRPFSAGAIVLLAGCTIAILVATVLWVQHNKAIYRRRGPRTSVPVVHHEYTHDRLGRPISLDRPSIRGAREIVLNVTPAGEKVYERAER
jgi:hypothetical protein